jgi:K+-transporting ATPase KdpF subunit
MRLPATICRATPMILDYVLGGLVTAFLLAYLVVALIKPERF